MMPPEETYGFDSFIRTLSLQKEPCTEPPQTTSPPSNSSQQRHVVDSLVFAPITSQEQQQQQQQRKSRHRQHRNRALSTQLHHFTEIYLLPSTPASRRQQIRLLVKQLMKMRELPHRYKKTTTYGKDQMNTRRQQMQDINRLTSQYLSSSSPAQKQAINQLLDKLTTIRTTP